MTSTRNHNLEINTKELLEQGLALVSSYSAEKWTNRGAHDPGITLLEQLVFQFTDLMYRVQQNKNDILFRQHTPDSLYFSRDKMLSSKALTPFDYRKLIIDGVDGVKNAWIRLQPYKATGINGMYAVELSLDESLAPNRVPEVVHSVQELLNENRNLSERVSEILVLTQREVLLSGSIELLDNCNPAKVVQDLATAVQHIYNAPIQYSATVHLEGPLLEKGVLEEASMQKRTSKVVLSDVIKTLSNHPDVLAVRDIKLEVEGESFTDAVYFKDSEEAVVKFKPAVDENEIGLLFFKGGEWQQDLPMFFESKNEPIEGLVQGSSNTNISGGLDGYDYSKYVALEEYLPEIYRLKAKEVGSAFGAYLGLFDEVFRNFLSSLNGVSDLLSVSVKEVEYEGCSDLELDKMSRFLDYLLAMYGESFKDNWLQEYMPYVSKRNKVKQQLHTKRQYLRELQDLNAEKAWAGDAYRVKREFQKLPGLLKKLYLQLDLVLHASELDWHLVSPSNPSYKKVLNRYTLVKELEEQLNPLPLNLNDKVESLKLDEDLPEALLRNGLDPTKYKVVISENKLSLVLASQEGFFLLQECSSFEHVRAYALAFFQGILEMTQKIEQLYCLEYTELLPDKQKGAFGIYLLGEDGEPVLRSTHLYTFSEREEVVSSLTSALQSEVEFKVVQKKNKYFEVVFPHEEERFQFKTIKEDQSAIKSYELEEHLNAFYPELTKAELVERLGYFCCFEEVSDDLFNERFFDGKLAFILPGFTHRFAKKSVRNKVSSQIKSLVPVHLVPEVFWLSNEQYKEFNKVWNSFCSEEDKSLHKGILAHILADLQDG